MTMNKEIKKCSSPFCERMICNVNGWVDTVDLSLPVIDSITEEKLRSIDLFCSFDCCMDCYDSYFEYDVYFSNSYNDGITEIRSEECSNIDCKKTIKTLYNKGHFHAADTEYCSCIGTAFLLFCSERCHNKTIKDYYID